VGTRPSWEKQSRRCVGLPGETKFAKLSPVFLKRSILWGQEEEAWQWEAANLRSVKERKHNIQSQGQGSSGGEENESIALREIWTRVWGQCFGAPMFRSGDSCESSLLECLVTSWVKEADLRRLRGKINE